MRNFQKVPCDFKYSVNFGDFYEIFKFEESSFFKKKPNRIDFKVIPIQLT